MCIRIYCDTRSTLHAEFIISKANTDKTCAIYKPTALCMEIKK